MKEKPGLAIIIAEKLGKKMKGGKGLGKDFLAAKKNEEPEEVEEADDAGEDMYAEIAQELLDAIDDKDAAAFGQALKSFVRVCEEDDMPSDEEE